MHIVYKTTCLKNGKEYIGAHTTDNLDDGYLGSGLAILRAIKNYGRHQFSREVLAFFESPEDMYAYEAFLVNEDYVSDRNNYNLQTGGNCGVKKSEETKEKIRRTATGRVWSNESRAKASAAKKGKPLTKKQRDARPLTRTESFKKKHSFRLLGSKNHMFGKPVSENVIKACAKSCNIEIGGIVHEFRSVCDAAKQLDIDRGMINYSIKHNKLVNSRNKTFRAMRAR